MSRIEDRPDISERLRAYEDWAKGAVTVQDVADTAAELAAGAAAEREEATRGGLKSAKEPAPGAEATGRARHEPSESRHEEALTAEQAGARLAERSADQEESGRRGALFLGSPPVPAVPPPHQAADVGRDEDQQRQRITAAQLQFDPTRLRG